MGNNPSDYRGDALPVHDVSWEDCQEFCEKTGFSLPTEAQWEYACRAGTSGAYAGTGNLDDMGWYGVIRHGKPHPIGEKQANDFGIHDMHGNVSEWCEAWYQKDFYQESTGARDPLCENSDFGRRVTRGGSWFHDALSCRSAKRIASRPSRRSSHHLGFRPTWSPP